MTLLEELTWRGFAYQTTYQDPKAVDGQPITFYLGVDPSADSMTVGNLAIAMMVKHFIKHGHKAVLLVGGATGLIGDPDGKAEERNLKSLEEIAKNKAAIEKQYRIVFSGQDFKVVDNYDWFKGVGYLQFLREVGKHVPMRQMLAREFIQTRLGEQGDGISYAEFSYALIQGYDFLHLFDNLGVTLQVCGSDQWGNCIAGVELIRRIRGEEANVWSAPLVINKATGKKFGKSEDGAIWLDPKKTTPTQFYQFWINCDDHGVGDYLKIYTELDKDEILSLMNQHSGYPQRRLAQTRLAQEVTRLVHGQKALEFAETVTGFLVGRTAIAEATDEMVQEIRANLPSVKSQLNGSILVALVDCQLASSNSDARRLLSSNAITLNNKKVDREKFEAADFQNGRLLMRRGKAYKDSALVELS